jgi:hypothetical protein
MATALTFNLDLLNANTNQDWSETPGNYKVVLGEHTDDLWKGVYNINNIANAPGFKYDIKKLIGITPIRGDNYTITPTNDVIVMIEGSGTNVVISANRGYVIGSVVVSNADGASTNGYRAAEVNLPLNAVGSDTTISVEVEVGLEAYPVFDRVEVISGGVGVSFRTVRGLRYGLLRREGLGGGGEWEEVYGGVATNGWMRYVESGPLRQAVYRATVRP